MSDKPLVLLGAGGHGKVLLSLAHAVGRTVIGVCDPSLASQGCTIWRGISVIGGDEALEQIDPSSTELINGVGQLVGGLSRGRLFAELKAKGFSFPVLAHPSAWIDPTAILSEGVQVMAGVVIQADVTIGVNSIVNTKAAIDHDCSIGVDVHVAPGAVLCGNVTVKDRAFIASGATVIQGLVVGEAAVVGAGATLTRDLGAGQILLGAGSRNKPMASE